MCFGEVSIQGESAIETVHHFLTGGDSSPLWSSDWGLALFFSALQQDFVECSLTVLSGEYDYKSHYVFVATEAQRR